MADMRSRSVELSQYVLGDYRRDQMLLTELDPAAELPEANFFLQSHIF